MKIVTNIIYPAFALFAFACFAFCPTLQGQGVLPEGNTALGFTALSHLTTGYYNTAVGCLTMSYDTTGFENTATGAGALLFNTTGSQNTATGLAALELNTTGSFNTANGYYSLSANTIGYDNTATGILALANNTGGYQNTANGGGALQFNTTGFDNTADGAGALNANTTGGANTATGLDALLSNNGDQNTADGFEGLYNSTSGSSNAAVGYQALFNNTTGSNNIGLGSGAGAGVVAANNVSCIGAGVAGADVDNSCYIGNIYTGDATGGLPVYVTSDGKLGAANPATASSARFKEEIKPMDKESDALFALKPVTFRYKKQIDPSGRSQFGLVAEDVEKVSPDLIMRDKEGKIYSVRYDAVNAMLLNEFLKEHKKTEKLEAAVASLIATVKEQAAQIQKVSAQLEASRSAPQVADSNY